MRVYELSKQLDMSTKELIALLKKKGFEVASHMSIVEDAAVDILTKQPLSSTPEKIKENKNSTAFKSDTGTTLIEESTHLNKTTKSPSTTPFIPPLSEEKNSKKSDALREKVVEKSDEIYNSAMNVGEFAHKVQKPVSEIIVSLLKKGFVCAKNQMLTPEIIKTLAQEYGLKVVEPPKHISSTSKVAIGGKGQEREPVVVIIGHVDHGKTTLLDYIRKSRVAAKEKGGITQHLGAYEVKTSQGAIVLLDTPGHEAFSQMRSRGVRIADIAILVVAADDGVKPQTIEAIKQAQGVNVPIIVALNKIDKAQPVQIEAAKRGLMTYGLVPEEWGGETIIVPISAKVGTGVDTLLEMISLQAQMMELKAVRTGPCKGFVLEAKVEKGFGPVATIIGQEGVVRTGDHFMAGAITGKVNALIDSSGKRLKEVGPSVPVRISGFDRLPNAGDFFEVINQESHKKLRSQHKEERVILTADSPLQGSTKEEILTIILKTDNNSSKEAISGSLQKLAKKNSRAIRLVHSGVGDISESDVSLAVTSGAIIYGFHVKADPKAIIYAQRSKITLHLFQIIYQLLDDITLRATKAPEVVYTPTKVGEAVVVCTFKIKNIGVIAGAQVKEGRLAREGKLIVKRGRQKIAEGSFKSLERERRSVKEVHAGFECAFAIEGFEDWQVDDRVECIVNVSSTVE